MGSSRKITSGSVTVARRYERSFRSPWERAAGRLPGSRRRSTSAIRGGDPPIQLIFTELRIYRQPGQRQVLSKGHVGPEARVLEHKTGTGLHPLIVPVVHIPDVPSFEEHLPRFRDYQPRRRLEELRFSAARGPDNHDGSAPGKSERNVFNHRLPGES